MLAHWYWLMSPAFVTPSAPWPRVPMASSCSQQAAGGQTGWLNPFAFVRAVRQFFAGPLVLAGGISDGYALRAAQALGCDLAYTGTKFIATSESLADPRYKAIIDDASADGIVLTRAFTGLQTNMLRPSIVAAGLDPDALPERGAIGITRDIDVDARESRPTLWRDIWSAGHSASGVPACCPWRTLSRRRRRSIALFRQSEFRTAFM